MAEIQVVVEGRTRTVTNERVCRMIRWIADNAERLARPDKGQIVFDFAGERRVTVKHTEAGEA